MQLLELPRSKVSIGAPMPWSVRNKAGDLLLRSGHVVKSRQELEALLERGAFVDAEEIRAVAREAQMALLSGHNQRPHVVSVFDMWRELPDQLHEVVHALQMGLDFLPGVESLAQKVAHLSKTEPDIGIFLTVRQEGLGYLHYGYSHSVHTAMVCALMAQRLEWAEHDAQALIKAALTMNLSILELQGKMASQDFATLESQRLQIRQHPSDAVDILKKAGVHDDAWLTAVADHHEHLDGSGYPHGRLDVGVLAQALRLADVFVAKLSPRIIRAPLTPQEAERSMYAEGKINPAVMTLAVAIIKEFGIYPPGDIVQLKSGEIGVVSHRSAGANTPVVAALTDVHGKPCTSTLQRDTSQAKYAIVGHVAHKALVARLPPERIYGYSKAT